MTRPSALNRPAAGKRHSPGPLAARAANVVAGPNETASADQVVVRQGGLRGDAKRPQETGGLTGIKTCAQGELLKNLPAARMAAFRTRVLAYGLALAPATKRAVRVERSST